MCVFHMNWVRFQHRHHVYRKNIHLNDIESGLEEKEWEREREKEAEREREREKKKEQQKMHYNRCG